MKCEIFFEELSKKSEIDERKANRDNRSRAKRKNESKKQTRHQKESKKQTKHQKESKRTRRHESKIENFTEAKAKSFFLLLTEKRKNTDIKTLKRLAIIVTVITKSYLSTNDVVDIIDESNKAKRRILS